MGSRGQSGGSGRESSGATSGAGGQLGGGKVNRLPIAGQTAFDEGNRTSVQATLDQWEKKHGTDKVEHLLMVDENGFATDYFKGNRGSVAFVPPADPSRITLTHSHPIGSDRTIGGSFSEADIINHIDVGFKETRATSVEGTYVFRATERSNPKGMKAALKTADENARRSAAYQFYKNNGAASMSQAAKFDVMLQEWHKELGKAAKANGYHYELIPN